MDWQPIKTAPKNGDIIIACAGNCHPEDWHTAIYIAFWCDAGAYGDRDEGFWADWGGGLDSAEFNDHEEWQELNHLTHWMPLPAQPLTPAPE